MYPQKTTFKRKSLFSKAGLMCALIGVSCKKVYLDTVRQLKYWSRHPNSLFWFLHSAFPISLSPCLPIFSFPPLFNTVSPLLPITLSPCPHLFFSISLYFSIWFCVFPSPYPPIPLSPYLRVSPSPHLLTCPFFSSLACPHQPNGIKEEGSVNKFPILYV